MDEAPEDVIFDEDDPSADWLDKATVANGGGRTPGVGGAANLVRPTLATHTSTGPVEIRQRKVNNDSAPLTNSVQENFREFSVFLGRWVVRPSVSDGGFFFRSLFFCRGIHFRWRRRELDS